MPSILTRKFSGAILFNRMRGEKGQGMLEYVLVLMVVLGIVFVLAKPVIARMQKTDRKSTRLNSSH